MLEPIYDTNIVVGIKLENNIEWYILDKYMCFMEGNDIEFNGETKEIRSLFPNISEKNIVAFLKQIEKYKMNLDLIRLSILEAIKKDKDLEDFFPVLLIDFDEKIFFSQYPEPIDYEYYLPENWEEKYISFRKYIPEEKQYWKYKGKDLFNDEKN